MPVVIWLPAVLVLLCIGVNAVHAAVEARREGRSMTLAVAKRLGILVVQLIA